MASLISNMAKEVFQILKGSGRTLSLYDEQSNKVFEPEDARSIFSNEDKLMISIDPDGTDSSLNMYISKSSDVDKMRKMIDNLRTTATRYNFLFNVRKYGKDLQPKDFAYKAEPMMESMWGTGRTSYQNIGSSKLIVRHDGRIQEDKRGARSRRIGSIFVETLSGERFRCPINSLTGARAYAKHLSCGGTPGDSFSNYIFAECEEQGKINRVRRHIRRLGEGNEQLLEVSTALTQWVQESKRRITRSKGERFYNGIIETINSNPNHIQALQAEIQESILNLSGLLGLDESDSLYPILETVAKTLLGSKLMDHINFEEQRNLRTYMSESADALDDLVESLEGEFGLVEGEHFTRSPVGIAILDDTSAAHAHMYAEGNQALTLGEAPEDKFYAYAKQWLASRADVNQMPELNTPDKARAELDRQAKELGVGLAQVVSGALNVKIKGGAMPKFTSQNAAISFKLDKLLAPGSGLGNDMLWNYVSSLSDDIAHGNKMDNNAKFFATRLAGIVDTAAQREMPEAAALESWAMDEAAPDDWDDRYDGELDANDHSDDYAERSNIDPEEVEEAINEFDFEDFMKDTGGDFEGWENGSYKELDTDDRSYTKSYIADAVMGYLERKLNATSGALAKHEYEIDDLLDETVIPALEQVGFFIDGIKEDMEMFEDVGDFLPDSVENCLQMFAEHNGGDFNYLGIYTGDDRDEDTYNFIRDFMNSEYASSIGDFDLYDHVNEVADFVEPFIAAFAAKSGEGEIDEATTDDDWKYPRRADDKYEDELMDNYESIAKDFIANPPQGSDLAMAIADAQGGHHEWDHAYFKDVVSETAYQIAKEAIAQTGGNDDDFDPIDMIFDGNRDKQIMSEIAKAIVKQYSLDATLLGEGELNERGNDQAAADQMTLRQVISTIGSFIDQAGDNDPEAILDRMKTYYMDSRTSGAVLHRNEGVVLDEIKKRVMGEGIEMNQGADFKSDIAYHSDEPDLEEIQRLRKLAGI